MHPSICGASSTGLVFLRVGCNKRCEAHCRTCRLAAMDWAAVRFTLSGGLSLAAPPMHQCNAPVYSIGAVSIVSSPLLLPRQRTILTMATEKPRIPFCSMGQRDADCDIRAGCAAGCFRAPCCQKKSLLLTFAFCILRIVHRDHFHQAP